LARGAHALDRGRPLVRRAPGTHDAAVLGDIEGAVAAEDDGVGPAADDGIGLDLAAPRPDRDLAAIGLDEDDPAVRQQSRTFGPSQSIGDPRGFHLSPSVASRPALAGRSARRGPQDLPLRLVEIE